MTVMPSKTPSLKSFQDDNLYIIAEAGVNHNGSLKTALEMVDAAKASGADAVKFQTWITEQVYSVKDSIKPDYQKAGTDPQESEFHTVKRLELSFDAFREIKKYCDKLGITMLSTPDERQSADFLIDELKLPAIKIASQDVNNLPFLRYLAGRKKPLIYSTGTASLAEVATATETMLSAGCPSLAVLHCTSCYPAPVETANLRAITTLRQALRLPIGYSDHTMGTEIGVAAVALGACILEKHFTLSRKLPGPDQQASLEPDELRRYIESARNVKAALGDGVKAMRPEEASNRRAMRRYLAASRALPAGHTLRSGDLALMKITFGLGPECHDLVVGAKLKTALAAGDRIRFDGLAFAPEAGFAGDRR